jgi:hypothetical protein
MSKSDASTITRTWKRFGGLNHNECEEADALFDRVKGMHLEYVKPDVAEDCGLQPGQWTYSQWYSITTSQCAECTISYRPRTIDSMREQAENAFADNDRPPHPSD